MNNDRDIDRQKVDEELLFMFITSKRRKLFIFPLFSFLRILGLPNMPAKSSTPELFCISIVTYLSLQFWQISRNLERYLPQKPSIGTLVSNRN